MTVRAITIMVAVLSAFLIGASTHFLWPQQQRRGVIICEEDGGASIDHVTVFANGRIIGWEYLIRNVCSRRHDI